MEDYDDFFDDEFDGDCEDMDIMEEEIHDDTEISLDVEGTPEPAISFEDFLFWGGFLGINIDEERDERRWKEKKKVLSGQEDNVKKKDHF